MWFPYAEFKKKPDFAKTTYFLIYIFILKNIYLFLESREREGERDKKHQCVVVSWVSSPGGLAHNPGMCPDWELNQQAFGSQVHTQSTELQQQGKNYFLNIGITQCSFVCRTHTIFLTDPIHMHDDSTVKAPIS